MRCIMKKLISIGFCLLMIFSLFPISVLAEGELIPRASSGLLMEISTGEILFEKDMKKEVAVASMTKMMSQVLILEAIENGKLKWEDKVQVSSNAAGFGGSQIWLQPNEVMSVRDLMKGISMASANDATVALAEEVAGSEESFVKMMNDKAKELGLENTNFVNSTGLDVDNHYSSAYDLALIAKHLLLEHPGILEFSSVYEDYLRVDTPNKFWLVNTNKLIRFYEGADGLKTGHTDAAKYCMAVTSKRNDMRLLAVVLGEETAAIRNEETAALLDYGFNNYKIHTLKSKDEVLQEVKIEKGNNDRIAIVPKRNITTLLKKDEEGKKYDYQVELENFQLPIKKGDTVGKLKILVDHQVIREEEVTVASDIDKLGFLRIWGNFLKDIVTGVY